MNVGKEGSFTIEIQSKAPVLEKVGGNMGATTVDVLSFSPGSSDAGIDPNEQPAGL